MLIIGDVHGKFKEWADLIANEKESLQIGDFGFNYPSSVPGHVFFPGNHDNHENYPDYCLGRYGEYRDMFFVGGAYSIDHDVRTEGIDWFRNEELSYLEQEECFRQYSLAKPDIVLSHDCPTVVRYEFGYPQNQTSYLLQCMFLEHMPKLWIFGHHHRSWSKTIADTKFVCLNELETYRLDV